MIRLFLFVSLFISVALTGCQSSENNELLDASAMGDTSKIELALKRGANLNTRDSDHGATPVIVAIWAGQLHAVKLLIQNGADQNLFGAGGTPLYWAAFYGRTEIFLFLKSQGAKLNVDDKSFAYLLQIIHEKGLADLIVEVKDQTQEQDRRY